MKQTCLSCGASLPDDATICDLCGTPVGKTGGERAGQLAGETPREAHGKAPPDAAHGIRFCSDCGTKSLENARFCHACGRDLGLVTAAAPGDASRPGRAPKPTGSDDSDSADSAAAGGRRTSDAAVGRQIGIIIGAAIMVVVALYLITTMSLEGNSEASAGAVADTALSDLFNEGPLPAQFAEQEAELRAEITASTDNADRERLHRRLVDVYLSAARLDLAARETRAVAELTNGERDWVAAGNMFYDWMETKPVEVRTPWAKEAIAAYQRALALNPDNNDVRTDMAIAYMYDSDNPMLAIQETNTVLSRDSLHVQANFNRGVMLMQINRMEQARQQFEKVKQLVGDPESPVYQRAEEALRQLASGE